jgi:hypothetical protein
VSDTYLCNHFSKEQAHSNNQRLDRRFGYSSAIDARRNSMPPLIGNGTFRRALLVSSVGPVQRH